MTKICIIGAVGSGKTYFSQKLSYSLNIPCYELDNIVYNGNKKRTKNLISNDFNKILKQNNWIIDSVYRPSFAHSFNQADYIIVLDIPLIIRINRIIKRWLKETLNIEKTQYKQNLKTLFNHLKWTIQAKKHKYKKFLNTYHKKIIILKNTNEKSLQKVITKIKR